MVRDVAEWLRGLGLEQYAAQFHGNDIDGAVLPDLTAEDLIGLGVGSIGHRRKLLAAIASLRDSGGRPTPAPEAMPPSTAGAERRQLTIMFCDLVGSTALATRLDPEDLREIIAAYHRRVSEVLTRFGGFVAKYMGDGVLAYFGYPEAHEDDAERAVRAGLAIVDAVAGLGLAQPLQVRIGVATGSAVVGDLIGSGAAQEQTVVGETPNLAARLQALAGPGTLVIAESTRRQLGSLFEVDDLGPQALKGFAEVQRAWRVAGESNVESRFAALRSGETPLVGREEELDLLLRRWAQAKTGEGRVVLLSAEPGIGKSRLTEALLQRVVAEKPAQLRCFCSPHHQDSALFPIIAQLERAAGFTREDGPTAKRDKLAALLAEGGAPAGDLPLLAELLSLPGAPSSPAPELPPQRKKELTFAALLRQIERLARRRPVLMVFEDLHWIDPTSRELLDRTIALVDHLPILLIATFRPEFQPPWTGQAHVALLALNRLGRSVGAALVRELAGDAHPLPAEIVDEIVERTDGVPLFLEEVTKVVLETAGAATAGGALAAVPGVRVAVPATLQASLMARLDRLGPVCREIAQTGSAIGRNFSYELLKAVSPRSAGETAEALDRLVAAGLVFQRGTPPAAEYQFKHALVQDTAYGTLLRGPRQALHARIAEMLSAGRGEAAGGAPEIVAHHLQSAGRSTEAIGYWRRAGEQAVRGAANREAIGHFRRALTLVAAEPETPERGRTELAILSQLGPALMSVHGWSSAEVGEVVERAAEVGRGLESSAELAPAIANLWIFNVARGRLDRAAEIAADVFRIGRELGDPDVMLQAHHCGWATSYHLGRFAEATEHIAAGTTLYDEIRHAHHRHVYLGHDPGVCLLNFAACVETLTGRAVQGDRLADEGIVLARRLSHAPSLANALWRKCEVASFCGDTASVTPAVEELLSLADAHGLPMPRAHAVIYRGWALCRSGETEAGIARLEEGRDTLARMGASVNLSAAFGLFAESLLFTRRYEEGLEQVARALELTGETGEFWCAARLHRLRAELLLHAHGTRDDAVEAELKRAIAIAQQQGAKTWEIGAATILARLWAERGRRAEARALLAPLYAGFTEGFETPDLRDAAAVLAGLA